MRLIRDDSRVHMALGGFLRTAVFSLRPSIAGKNTAIILRAMESPSDIGC